MVEYIMIDEMLTNESGDTAAYMSALQLELSEISPQNKKSPVPQERDEAYARGSTLLPSDLSSQTKLKAS